MSNPFEGHELPSPDLGDADAHRLLTERFGVDGTLHPLGSHQDQNWRVDTQHGRFVLKVSNPGFPRTGLEAQNAAMLHLAAAGVDFDVPVPQPSTTGELIPQWQHRDRVFDVRLVTYLDGQPLADFDHLDPSVLGRQGALAARCALALSDFDHPGLDRDLQWDCRHAFDVVAALIQHVADPDLRDLVLRHAGSAEHALSPLARDLRIHVVHADVTDVNVVASRDAAGRPLPHGLIDFGDISRTWLVSDAAVAAASLVLHDVDDPLPLVRDVVLGFHEVMPLSQTEIDAVWPLVVARAALCVVSSEQQAALEPNNEYAQESRQGDEAIMRAVAAVPPALAQAVLRAAAGFVAVTEGSSLPRLGPVVADQQTLQPVDLSVTSTRLLPDRWSQRDDLAAALAPAGPGATVVGRYGEARLPDAVDDSPEEPATIHLGIDVFSAAGTPVLAPVDAVVSSVAPLRLAAPRASHHLVLGGVEPIVATRQSVTTGQVIGYVSSDAGSSWPPHVHVQWVEPDLEAPDRCRPSVRSGWTALCPDPSASLGVPPPTEEPTSSRELLSRRDAVVAAVQEHYYATPPRIERGWRHHLYDADARSYLDMVNNVATLGHSHPAVTEAVSRRLQLLNTNSRFNYEVIVEFSERLAGLLPDPLDTVFLVNSGSEAVDLALRIAWNATGHEHVLAVESGYHGWTTATDAISTSLADNPDALTTRPDWVHTVLSPNRYRGQHRGPDAAQRYAEDVARAVADVRTGGGGVAAFIAEALYGNAGGVLLPAGYLSSAYETVRAAGGLCIADEVQVGYGRTGHHFWAFEEQGVVPDLVTVAKAAGNGIALGAVVTTRAIADAFAAQGSFFSSVGGSPVSCAAGLAVIDTMQSEGSQQNAQVVGDRLRRRLEQLAERHPLIGAVHGLGLYLGVELVRDQVTLEPAVEETAAICDRMLALGVVVQPTGDHLNVLKVKPPLCLTSSSADFFVDTLDEVLSRGW